MTKKIKAFTLVELLVVISIIALLLAILMPSLSKARYGARLIVCGTRQRGILQALNAYMAANNNKMPPTVQGHWRNKATGDAWYTVPVNLKYYYKSTSPEPLNGGSLVASIGPYLANAQYFLCPISNSRTEHMDKFLNPKPGSPEDLQVTFMASSYYYFWNWLKLKDVYASSGFTFLPVAGRDTLMIMDMVSFQDPVYVSGYGIDWISSHQFKGGAIAEMPGQTLKSPYRAKFYTRKVITDSESAVPPFAVNAGYLDGHVSKFNVSRTGQDCDVVGRESDLKWFFPKNRK